MLSPRALWRIAYQEARTDVHTFGDDYRQPTPRELAHTLRTLDQADDPEFGLIDRADQYAKAAIEASARGIYSAADARALMARLRAAGADITTTNVPQPNPTRGNDR